MPYTRGDYCEHKRPQTFRRKSYTHIPSFALTKPEETNFKFSGSNISLQFMKPHVITFDVPHKTKYIQCIKTFLEKHYENFLIDDDLCKFYFMDNIETFYDIYYLNNFVRVSYMPGTTSFWNYIDTVKSYSNFESVFLVEPKRKNTLGYIRCNNDIFIIDKSRSIYRIMKFIKNVYEGNDIDENNNNDDVICCENDIELLNITHYVESPKEEKNIKRVKCNNEFTIEDIEFKFDDLENKNKIFSKVFDNMEIYECTLSFYDV